MLPVDTVNLKSGLFYPSVNDRKLFTDKLIQQSFQICDRTIENVQVNIAFYSR